MLLLMIIALLLVSAALGTLFLAPHGRRVLGRLRSVPALPAFAAMEHPQLSPESFDLPLVGIFLHFSILQDPEHLLHVIQGLRQILDDSLYFINGPCNRRGLSRLGWRPRLRAWSVLLMLRTLLRPLVPVPMAARLKAFPLLGRRGTTLRFAFAPGDLRGRFEGSPGGRFRNRLLNCTAGFFDRSGCFHFFANLLRLTGRLSGFRGVRRPSIRRFRCTLLGSRSFSLDFFRTRRGCFDLGFEFFHFPTNSLFRTKAGPSPGTTRRTPETAPTRWTSRTSGYRFSALWFGG